MAQKPGGARQIGWVTLVWTCACLSVVALAQTPRKNTRVRRTAATTTEKASSATGRVTEIRFWTLGEATRVAIQVDSEFQYRSDKLANPDRLFFDIIGVKPQSTRKGMETIPVGDTILRQIRVAETQPGTTRIVLDLKGNAEYSASQLSNPDRLIIELRNPNRKGPVLSASTTSSKKVSDVALTPIEPDMVVTPPPPVPTSKPAAPKPEPPAEQPPTKASQPKSEPPASTPSVTSRPEPIAISAAPAPPRITPPPDAAAPSQPRVTPKVEPTSTPPPPTGSMPKETEPAPARRNTTGDRSMTRVLGLKLGRIVLDPGHGGHDQGTHGPTGLLEKDLVLDVAKRLGALIEERLGSEVIYTRSDDTFIPLEQRTRIANDRKADLFLSIHANSSPIRTASGVETYYLNFTTSKAALDLAMRENAGSQRSIYDLKELLEKIALKDKLDESREFASKVQNSLSTLTIRTGKEQRDRGVRRAPFVVLIGASMPSVLAEIGFVSNVRDENLMKKPEYRQKIAEALYKGLAQYASGLSHFQVAQRKPGE